MEYDSTVYCSDCMGKLWDADTGGTAVLIGCPYPKDDKGQCDPKSYNK